MKILKHIVLIPIVLLGLQISAQGDELTQEKRFQAIDADENEIITIRELNKFYKGKTNRKGEAIDSELMFYGLDRDNNSIITLREFVKGVDWKAARHHQNIKRRGEISSNQLDAPSENYNSKQVDNFHKIDSDNNKLVSLKEMLDYHEDRLNRKGDPFQAGLFFYGLDSNSDDQITLNEYIQKPDWKAAKERKASAQQRLETRLLTQTPKEKRKVKRKIRREKNKVAKQDVTVEEPKIKVKKVQESLSSIEERQVSKFEKIDKDDNKVIDINEMMDFHKGKINKKGQRVESELMFYGLDTDDNGELTIGEFSKKVNWKVAKQKMKEKQAIHNN